MFTRYVPPEPWFFDNTTPMFLSNRTAKRLKFLPCGTHRGAPAAPLHVVTARPVPGSSRRKQLPIAFSPLSKPRQFQMRSRKMPIALEHSARNLRHKAGPLLIEFHKMPLSGPALPCPDTPPRPAPARFNEAEKCSVEPSRESKACPSAGWPWTLGHSTNELGRCA